MLRRLRWAAIMCAGALPGFASALSTPVGVVHEGAAAARDAAARTLATAGSARSGEERYWKIWRLTLSRSGVPVVQAKGSAGAPTVAAVRIRGLIFLVATLRDRRFSSADSVAGFDCPEACSVTSAQVMIDGLVIAEATRIEWRPVADATLAAAIPLAETALRNLMRGETLSVLIGPPGAPTGEPTMLSVPLEGFALPAAALLRESGQAGGDRAGP